VFRIKVLVVDDSIVMRRIIADLLSKDPEIEVVGSARNGAEALEKVSELNPDVVTMDIEMPIMDGLTALQHIMAESPRGLSGHAAGKTRRNHRMVGTPGVLLPSLRFNSVQHYAKVKRHHRQCGQQPQTSIPTRR